MSDLSWLKKVKESFISTGLDYEDLYGVIEASIKGKRTNFPAFIYEASNGFGFCVGEGYFYSLDQDWDDPDAFDMVSFFLGEMETSSISIPDYVFLMKMAAEIYSDYFPADRDRVLASAIRLEERYSNKFPD
ncbi:hypothetical protein RA224_11800 [Achromobacter aegrifaciens]|uniref:hypothetical protein n=1 Tax=Achromobacter aegrifaciens TaxID=1287736 RepID=UPI0027BA6795|nr:hypothetical protein [Achromobacter aegrifaciens]WLW64074.1 hypothetical protein RA224_11800 [Achromobacter aegrifaciens]